MCFFLYLCRLKIMKKTINIHGNLYDWSSSPIVMGVVNVSPESFYTACSFEEEIVAVVEKAIEEGATILDLGAQSTKPSAPIIAFEEEWRRLQLACSVIRKRHPNVLISVDTMRSEIARRVVQEYNINIINDISGGEADVKMFETIAHLNVPYIVTHIRGTLQNAMQYTNYNHLLQEIISYFEKKVDTLHQLGVKDVIIDPGFGFAKMIEQNYELLRKLDYLAVLETPILVGVSHKSMIYKPLNITPYQALNGTTALHILALQKGANILRVHEVQPAMECIRLHHLMNNM